VLRPVIWRETRVGGVFALLDAGRPTGYGRRRCNTCRGRVGVRRLPGCRKSAGVAGEAIGHFLNPDQAVDLKDIKVIIDLMKKNSLSEFELEKEVDRLEIDYKESHIERVEQGICNPSAGMLYIEVLRNLERIGDHAVNLSGDVLLVMGNA
jgi:hypothetical protein